NRQHGLATRPLCVAPPREVQRLRWKPKVSGRVHVMACLRKYPGAAAGSVEFGAKEPVDLADELAHVLEEEAVAGVAPQDRAGVGETAGGGIGGEGVDHDVVGAVGQEYRDGELVKAFPPSGKGGDGGQLALDGLGADGGHGRVESSCEPGQGPLAGG